MRVLNASNNENSVKILHEIRTAFQRLANASKILRLEDVEIISGDKEGKCCSLIISASSNMSKRDIV